MMFFDDSLGFNGIYNTLSNEQNQHFPWNDCISAKPLGIKIPLLTPTFTGGSSIAQKW